MTFKKITIGWMAAGTLALSFLLYRNLTEGKTGYVEVNKLFNGFDMTKETNKQLESRFKGQEVVMDSLYYMIDGQIQQAAEDPGELQARKSKYNEMRYEFEAGKEAEKEKLNNSVLERMNGYVKQFGEENNYKVILGANGSGSLMYSSEAINITEDVLKFINDKYKGK